MLTIEIEAAGNGRFHAWLGDKLLCTSLTPFFEGARVLLDMGHKPTAMVQMQHRGAEWVALKPTRIGFAAKLAVMETSAGKGPPRFAKWTPPEFRIGAPSIAQNEEVGTGAQEAAE